MQRIDKINEIIKLLNEYFNITSTVKTPTDLNNFMMREMNKSFLSKDNNYRNLKFFDIIFLLKIENLYQEKKITKQESDTLEAKYFEYLTLEYQKGQILYESLMKEIDKKIPKNIENKLKEIRELFNSYGLNIETDNFVINTDNICKKSLIKKSNL